MKPRPSSGDRVVWCTREDCVFSGDDETVHLVAVPGLATAHWFRCEANIIVMDRRPVAGKTCGRFALVKPARGAG